MYFHCKSRYSCMATLATNCYRHLWLIIFKFLFISGLPYIGQLEMTMWRQCNALLKMELVSMFKATLG